MSATLRVPIAEMDAALAGVRALGRVVKESQASEDVTDAHRDLAIRISNAKIEEARLGEILKDRTGKLSDVLAVEQAQSRMRTEIEQMEAAELSDAQPRRALDDHHRCRRALPRGARGRRFTPDQHAAAQCRRRRDTRHSRVSSVWRSRFLPPRRRSSCGPRYCLCRRVGSCAGFAAARQSSNCQDRRRMARKLTELFHPSAGCTRRAARGGGSRRCGTATGTGRSASPCAAGPGL